MTISRFKFPRRVRIHGGECGAVARALHHEAKKNTLLSYEQTLVSDEKPFLRQADFGKAPGSTIERKQMSTKTTLKRIALVAVSALGFGMLSVTPSLALATGLSVDKSSITVVAPTTVSGTDTPTAVVAITVSNNTALTGLGSLETVTATVTSVPAGTSSTAKSIGSNAADLRFRELIQPETATELKYYSTLANDSGNGTESDVDGKIGTNNTGYRSSQFNGGTYSATQKSLTYFMGIEIAYGATVIDQGVYTVSLALTDSNGNQVASTTVKVDYVSTAAKSDAKITLASAGNLQVADSFSYSNQSSTKYLTATVTNRDGGRLIAHRNDSLTHIAPALTAELWSNDGAGTAATSSTLTLAASDSRSFEWSDGLATRDNQSYDGVYTIYDPSTAAPLPGINAGANTVKVRYGATLGSLAITVLSTPAATAAATDVTLTAAGMAAGRDQIVSNDTSETWKLPLTTTTASLKLTAQTASSAANSANQALRVIGAWSGAYVSADVTPAVDYDKVLYTNASGDLTISISNKTPLNGATLTLTISGFVSGGSATYVLTWEKPTVTTVSVLDPLASTKVKAGTANTFTVAVLDQFGNPMSGEILQPSLGSTSDNYVASTTYATITTGSAGTATWTLTDATATDATSDAVTFTSASVSTVSGSRTLSYVTTVPAVSTLTAYYDYDWDSTQSASNISTLVPSTGIYTAVGGSTRLSLTSARNISVPATSSTDADNANDMILYRVNALTSAGAAAAGAVVTVTPGPGAFILNSSDVPSTAARNFVVSTLGDIYFKGGATGTGAISFTITSGTASATASQWVTNGTNGASGRFVTVTGAASGTANGDGVPVTVKVTDRYGNAVSGVALNLVASGVGSFAGGATVQTYNTTSTGEFTFLATSTVAAGGKGTFTVTSTTSGEFTSAAGYVVSTPVDSTLKAGNASAALDITFAAGKSSATVSAEAATAAAEAATDAASEAIDAANAATDAANLAAEAADAATVAAEEARDAADAATAAVEELATQVATLMAALKAQITTLANTVAKIAKKVKA